VLRDWQGLSYGEIAAQMAVSDSAVETLLFRARNKVAAALVNGEWRRRLAPSARALLIWPFAFLRTKTAATTAAEHLKLGLALAGGAVAPLIAFGVLQIFSQPNETARAARPPVATPVEGSEPGGFWLERQRLPHAWTGPAALQTEAKAVRDGPGRHRASPGRAAAQASAQEQSGEPASAPVAAAEPKIVLCHTTPSEAQPGVTVSVSPHALAGLGDDERGACD
jgi:hypothetical protein